MRVLALAVLLAAAGCLGNEKTFPDESDQVRALHVNAFEATSGASPRPALVQVSGLGPDGQERAFRADVHIALEKALHPEKDVAYSLVKGYDESVTAQDFGSPTVPYWTLTIPAGDLPEEGTYRVTATARVAGHAEPLEAFALFAYAAS